MTTDTSYPPKAITLAPWRGTYLAPCQWNPLSQTVTNTGEFVQLKYEKLPNSSRESGRARKVGIIHTPGWYESREGYRTHNGQTTPKRYWRVTRTTVEEVTLEHVQQAIDGPAPGEPGEWFGDTCECGEPLQGYDEDGWPYCQDHHPERFQIPAWRTMTDKPVPA